MNSLTWVFAPGSNSSKLQVLKYKRVWEGEHGELAVSCNECLGGDGDFIGSNVTTMDFSDVVQRDVTWSKDWRQWPRQVFQAAIALTVKWRRSESFKVRRLGTKPIMKDHSLDWRQFNLGQSKDMQTFGDALQSHRAQFPDLPIVLYGVSRGAATVVNFVASATPEQLKDVVGIVLEGCPDSLRSIIQDKLSWLCYWPLGGMVAKVVSLVERCWELVTSYSSTGPSPLDNIDKIPEHIPVLLVTSLGDKLVPLACTQRLLSKLNGRQNVQTVVLPTASHPRYTRCEPDCSLYWQAIWDFYDGLITDKGQTKDEE